MMQDCWEATPESRKPPSDIVRDLRHLRHSGESSNHGRLHSNNKFSYFVGVFELLVVVPVDSTSSRHPLPVPRVHVRTIDWFLSSPGSGQWEGAQAGEALSRGCQAMDWYRQQHPESVLGHKRQCWPQCQQHSPTAAQMWQVIWLSVAHMLHVPHALDVLAVWVAARTWHAHSLSCCMHSHAHSLSCYKHRTCSQFELLYALDMLRVWVPYALSMLTAWVAIRTWHAHSLSCTFYLGAVWHLDTSTVWGLHMSTVWGLHVWTQQHILWLRQVLQTPLRWLSWMGYLLHLLLPLLLYHTIQVCRGWFCYLYLALQQ